MHLRRAANEVLLTWARIGAFARAGDSLCLICAQALESGNGASFSTEL